jgi:hypothetical protein
MELPHEQETNRNPDGTFKPDISGNPGGRPVGSFSIVSMIRREFEKDAVHAIEWVAELMENPRERQATMERQTASRERDLYPCGHAGRPN